MQKSCLNFIACSQPAINGNDNVLLSYTESRGTAAEKDRFEVQFTPESLKKQPTSDSISFSF